MDMILASPRVRSTCSFVSNAGGGVVGRRCSSKVAKLVVVQRTLNRGPVLGMVGCVRGIWAKSSFSSSHGRISHSLELDHISRVGIRRHIVSAVAEERGAAAAAAAVSIKEEELRSSNARDTDEEDDVYKTGVIVVGGGLAGLAAAKYLAKEGIPFRLLEASDGVGGRVRTDSFQGFLLDRGFQIHITAYPEAERVLDYEKLELKTFYAGASVWFDGEFHRVADPFRHFADGLMCLFNPIGNVFDKALVAIVAAQVTLKSGDDILSSKERTIQELLFQNGFSAAMVDRFFRPFFGGIFFDRELQTTSRLFDFVFKCLALGSNTLPAGGIGAIPEQLAAGLPVESILLNSKVAKLVEDSSSGAVVGVKLENGKELRAKYGVVVAVEGPEASRLLETNLPTTTSVTHPARSTTCLYFWSDKEPPTREPILFLNGSGDGIVNNMFFPTNVAPSYAPPGQTLVSVSLIGTFDDWSDAELERRVREELSAWFGTEMVGNWQHLRTYRIPFAQPNQTPPTDLLKDPRVCDGAYICGDHRDSSTFDGALVSGRRAVQALISDKVLSTR